MRATVVAFNDSNRKNKFFIHFDKPYAGVTTEKVDLKGTLGTLGTIR